VKPKNPAGAFNWVPVEVVLDDGSCVAPDSVIAFTAGRADSPREAVLVYPGGWVGRFESIRIEVERGESYPLLIAFPKVEGGKVWEVGQGATLRPRRD
jgi:hypothetical protein